MIKFKKNLNKKGIILIEALLALTVIVIVMTALVTALVSALSSATFSNEQTMATAYAQEGIEIARALKNQDYSEFQSDATGLEQDFGKDSVSIEGTGTLFDNKFQRVILLSNSGCDSGIFVSSIVRWSGPRCSGGDKCHEVILNSCFTNLDQAPAP